MVFSLACGQGNKVALGDEKTPLAEGVEEIEEIIEDVTDDSLATDLVQKGEKAEAIESEDELDNASDLREVPFAEKRFCGCVLSPG